MEDKYVFKNPTTIRLSAEEAKIAEEMIVEMFPEFDPTTTSRLMFNSLLDRANTKTKLNSASKPSDLETIQFKENEIGRLQILTDQRKTEIENANNLNLEKDQKIEELNQKVQNLQSGLPSSDQVVVDLSPLQKKLIALAAERLSSRYKKEISPAQILKQIFINYTKQESELDFPYVLSYSDVVKLKNAGVV